MASFRTQMSKRTVSILSVGALCVAQWAGGLAYAETATALPSDTFAGVASPGVGDISGRWHGLPPIRSKACAPNEERCGEITLDISRCGETWCGVEVQEDGHCGAIALKVAAKTDAGQPRFEGSLSLAKSTEPYNVMASLAVYAIGQEPPQPRLEIVGDTGGDFSMFRRSFPFHTLMTRSGPVTCTPEKALSLLE